MRMREIREEISWCKIVQCLVDQDAIQLDMFNFFNWGIPFAYLKVVERLSLRVVFQNNWLEHYIKVQLQVYLFTFVNDWL